MREGSQMTNAAIAFAPALPTGANKNTAMAEPPPGRMSLQIGGLQIRLREIRLRALPGRVLAAYGLLFVAGLASGIAITSGLRAVTPRLVDAVSAAPSPAIADLDLSDPAYDLKRTPQPVWHISAPLAVEIERAKRDLEAALQEDRK